MNKKKISVARVAAFRVLEEVEGGGYASDLLREATAALSPRDAGLAGQLVMGSLRVQNQLDFLIEKYSGRSADGLDAEVRMALRVGIFQLRYLERIPAHAAVDDAVEFVKQRKRAASGLTNAVLRKANREVVEWPTQALRLACPEWLLTRWTEHFGAEQARAIAAAALREPEPFVRIAEGDMLPAGADLEPTEVAGCYRVLSPVVEGMRLHDVGSQSVVPLLELEAGQSYLDLCAAPGNKTAQAMESRPGLAVACDISERRLEMVQAQVAKVVLDASEQLPFGCTFDRILIDAPCSGTGTLGRNPEIKWRLEEGDLRRHTARQVNILKRAVKALAPGGRVVYATCSLEPEENESVLEAVIRERVVRRVRETWRLPGRERGDGFYGAVLEAV